MPAMKKCRMVTFTVKAVTTTELAAARRQLVYKKTGLLLATLFFLARTQLSQLSQLFPCWPSTTVSYSLVISSICFSMVSVVTAITVGT